MSLFLYKNIMNMFDKHLKTHNEFIYFKVIMFN